MIGFSQFMTGVAMGFILIVIGFVPGPLDKWAAAISDTAGALLSRLHGLPVPSQEPTEFGQQRWLGALGMALIALSLYLYIVRQTPDQL